MSDFSPSILVRRDFFSLLISDMRMSVAIFPIAIATSPAIGFRNISIPPMALITVPASEAFWRSALSWRNSFQDCLSSPYFRLVSVPIAMPACLVSLYSWNVSLTVLCSPCMVGTIWLYAARSSFILFCSCCAALRCTSLAEFLSMAALIYPKESWRSREEPLKVCSCPSYS